MEPIRWIRGMRSTVAVAGRARRRRRARPAAGRSTAADPPWEPPPCPARPTGAGPDGAPGVVPPRRDPGRRGHARRPAAGSSGGSVAAAGRSTCRPESFATGPCGGLVLVGADDGRRSRLLAPRRRGRLRDARSPRRTRSCGPRSDAGRVGRGRAPRGSRDPRGPRRLAACRSTGAAPGGSSPGSPADAALRPHVQSTELAGRRTARLAVTSRAASARCRTRLVGPGDRAARHVDRADGAGRRRGERRVGRRARGRAAASRAPIVAARRRDRADASSCAAAGRAATRPAAASCSRPARGRLDARSTSGPAGGRRHRRRSGWPPGRCRLAAPRRRASVAPTPALLAARRRLDGARPTASSVPGPTAPGRRRGGAR